jgi:hypothetical protein
MWGLLIVNILEATVTDALTITIANYLNVIAGVLLIFTLDPLKKVFIDKKNKTKDFLWPSLSFQWIIAYSIWNITFVYLNFPSTTLRHIALLAVPLIVAYYIKGVWIQTRAFTLAAYFIAAFTFSSFFNSFNTPNLGNDLIGLILASLSLTYILSFTILKLIPKSYFSNKKLKFMVSFFKKS